MKGCLENMTNILGFKIDPIDQCLLDQYRWLVSTNGYVVANRNKKKLYLHRVIMEAPEGMEVDHINLDKLDNRRNNLRIVTGSQNKMNRLVQKNNRNGLKGITFEAGKWRVRIQANGNRYNIGSYSTQKEATKQYHLAADILHGEFKRSDYSLEKQFKETDEFLGI